MEPLASPPGYQWYLTPIDTFSHYVIAVLVQSAEFSLTPAVSEKILGIPDRLQTDNGLFIYLFTFFFLQKKPPQQYIVIRIDLYQ